MTTPHAEQTRRARDWYGFRPSSARLCPRVVAGKRCAGFRQHGDPCVCERYAKLLDHARVWIDEDGYRVLTADPYQAAGEHLAGLMTEVAEFGLRVTLDGRSLWYPGNTVLIVVEQDPQAEVGK